MNTKRRGFALITAMFIVLLVGLFGSAMLSNGPLMGRLANQAADEVRAQYAAETGAAYARLQLRENLDWKGDLNKATVDTPGFKVSERDGNVLGWIRGEDGQVSMFRIRFNYQDGSVKNTDELPDPPSGYRIATPYLSINNLRASSDKPVPKVDPVTFVAGGAAAGGDNVPPLSVFLRVEGLAGAALASIESPAVTVPDGLVASRVLRGVYGAVRDGISGDSVLTAANGIRVQVKDKLNVYSSTGPMNQKVNLRTTKGVSVKSPVAGGTTTTIDFARDVIGKVHYGAGLLDALVSNGKVQAGEDGRNFHQLKWKDVPKASSDPGHVTQMRAGVYIFSGDKCFYFDHTLAKVKSILGNQAFINSKAVQLGATDITNDLKSMGIDYQKDSGNDSGDELMFRYKIGKNLDFKTSPNGVQDVVFTTPMGRELFDGDSKDYLLATSKNQAPEEILIATLASTLTRVELDDCIVSSPGDLVIAMDVKGTNSSLTSEGNTVIASTGVSLKVDSDSKLSLEPYAQRLSVYSKKDLTLSSYLHIDPYQGSLFGEKIDFKEIKKYWSLDLDGLFYSWGDLNIYGGTPNQDSQEVEVTIGNSTYKGKNYGDINVGGALVAYGGDPDGSVNFVTATHGKINMTSEHTNLDYDLTKLGLNDPNQLDGPIVGMLRKSYGFEN